MEGWVAENELGIFFCRVGETVAEAAWWFIALERACEIQLKAEATGSPLKLVAPEKAAHSAKHLATPFMGWLHFQPIYDWIIRTDPDLVN